MTFQFTQNVHSLPRRIFADANKFERMCKKWRRKKCVWRRLMVYLIEIRMGYTRNLVVDTVVWVAYNFATLRKTLFSSFRYSIGVYRRRKGVGGTDWQRYNDSVDDKVTSQLFYFRKEKMRLCSRACITRRLFRSFVWFHEHSWATNFPFTTCSKCYLTPRAFAEADAMVTNW